MKPFEKLNYKIVVGLLFASLLSSCDAEHMWDYYIVNEINETIWIEHQIWDKTEYVDYILPDDTTLIYTYSYIIGTAGVYDLREEDQITYWKIIVGDTIVEVNESLWLYEETGKYHANYLLIVDSTLLNLN